MGVKMKFFLRWKNMEESVTVKHQGLYLLTRCPSLCIMAFHVKTKSPLCWLVYKCVWHLFVMQRYNHVCSFCRSEGSRHSGRSSLWCCSTATSARWVHLHFELKKLWKMHWMKTSCKLLHVRLLTSRWGDRDDQNGSTLWAGGFKHEAGPRTITHGDDPCCESPHFFRPFTTISVYIKEMLNPRQNELFLISNHGWP